MANARDSIRQEKMTSGGRMDEIIRAVRDCPSGALSFAIDGVEARNSVDFHDTRPPAIEVTKDGPYRITGSIALEEADGSDVRRNAGGSREHFALCRCGAGLPNDAEFASAFQAYIGWGSRLAVENSQPSGKPPEHMPMPHWDWITAAGPPGHCEIAEELSTQTEVKVTSVRANQVRKNNIPAGILRVNRRTFRQATE